MKESFMNKKNSVPNQTFLHHFRSGKVLALMAFLLTGSYQNCAPFSPMTQSSLTPDASVGLGTTIVPGATPVPGTSLTPVTPTVDPIFTVSSLGDGNRSIGPNYTPDSAIQLGNGIPKGTILNFTMQSSESKIFPGNTPGTGAYSRQVWVYVPKQYVTGQAAPFMVTQDAFFLNIAPTILDNYIAQKKLPVMILIFASNGGGDAFGTERNLEYDTVSGLFGEWVQTELLPRAAAETKKQLPAQAVTFTNDPDGRGTMGGSSGAAAAFSMAWWHPEWFRRVISYSGTFVNRQSPKDPALPHGAWEYHEKLIPQQSITQPIRMWFEVGTNDLNFDGNTPAYLNWQSGNMNMAKVLSAGGYHYHFDLAEGAGHEDERAIEQTLPEALVWLWRGYPIP
jgi:enterochelin esterase family protein